MMRDTEDVNRGEAQESLDSIKNMERAGWRRAVPHRWFGLGVAVLIASLFALYALEDPYPYIVFPIIGLAIFITAAREKSGAYGRDFPGTKANAWVVALVAVILLIVFFGSIVIRRTYDVAWVPLVVGSLVGLFVFLASEHERRAYLTMSGQGRAK